MSVDQVEKKDPFGLSRLDDPEFEAKERARLMGIDKGDTPSPEVQQAFLSWINHITNLNRWTGRFNVLPDKLFFGHLQKNENGSFFNRTYYKHPSTPEFSGKDIQAQLSLRGERPGTFGGTITRHGEMPNLNGKTSEEVSIRFMNNHFSEKERLDLDKVSIKANFEGRELILDFDKNGDINTILFRPRETGKENLYASDLTSRSFFKMKELFETGRAAYSKGGSVYEVTYDGDAGKLSLTHKEGEKVKDVITLPRHLDKEGIFNNLFPEPFLKDIYGASTEADDTWKDFNLETVGVNWDRPTPNPNP